MMYENTLAIEYADKPGEWTFQHVTGVNDSCLKKHGNRLRLRRMLIGDVVLFGVLMVSRIDAETFQIYRKKYSFEAALAFIENRMDAAKPKQAATQTRKPKQPLPPLQGCEPPLHLLPLFQGLTHAA